MKYSGGAEEADNPNSAKFFSMGTIRLVMSLSTPSNVVWYSQKRSPFYSSTF